MRGYAFYTMGYAYLRISAMFWGMRCLLTESWPEDHYVRLPGVETSCDLIERLPSHVRLAMSRGKDALSAWIHLRAHGKTVDPVFYWTVPGVPFEETDLARLEQHFGTKVRQISHPAYWRFMREELYQPPLAVALIRKLNIREPKWDEIHHGAAKPARHGNHRNNC